MSDFCIKLKALKEICSSCNDTETDPKHTYSPEFIKVVEEEN